MSADKRSVSTDALETLGTIIGHGEKRDAIHLAVLPVEAGTDLLTGECITSMNGIAHKDKHGLGIVDPFLPNGVKKGQMFWMVLKPRIIKSLRHVWSHPAFADEGATEHFTDPRMIAASEKLGVIASRCDLEYDEIIEAAHAYLDHGTYLHDGGRFEGVYVSDEFWNLFEIVTGRKVPDNDRDSFFSCSC